MSGEEQVSLTGGSQGCASSAQIPRLNGKNYQSWKELVGIVLELGGLKDAIETECVDIKTQLQAKLIVLETLDESHKGAFK